MVIVAVVLIALAVLFVVGLGVAVSRPPEPGTTRMARYRRRRVRMAPQFRLERLSQHRYVLHNDGGTAAHDVRIDTADLTITEGETHLREFDPGHAEHYMIIQPMHGHISELVVRWRLRHRGGAEQVSPLPLDIEAASEGQEA